ncbi:hypothetical protein AB0870_08395 [Microbacterium proteolyticum]|uniref:hypothetical protein n=1 Tax=Microbacterium proteolyticum TaxID=1572644 RepID=UPI00345C2846
MSDTFRMQGEGVVLRGAPSPSDPTGLFIGPDGLQGWQGLPARRREQLVRALGDGEHDVPVRLPARVMTIDPGVILAASTYELQRFCDQMNGWGATGVRFPLIVQQLGQTLRVTVRVIASEGVDLNRYSAGLHHGLLSAQLVAPDPRKYAVEQRAYPVVAAGGSVLVPSRGNFPAHPVIEIPAAPASWSVSSPAGTFSVTGAPAGGTHRVDLRTGRVYRDGGWLPGVGRGRLWAVPHGTQWAHTLSAPGRVLIRDTYV